MVSDHENIGGWVGSRAQHRAFTGGLEVTGDQVGRVPVAQSDHEREIVGAQVEIARARMDDFERARGQAPAGPPPGGHDPAAAGADRLRDDLERPTIGGAGGDPELLDRQRPDDRGRPADVVRVVVR